MRSSTQRRSKHFALPLLLLASFLVLSIGCEKKEAMDANYEMRDGGDSANATGSAQRDSLVTVESTKSEYKSGATEQLFTPQEPHQDPASATKAGATGAEMDVQRERLSKSGARPAASRLADKSKSEAHDDELADQDIPEALVKANAAADRMLAAQQGELWAKPVVRDNKLIQPGQPFPLKSTDVKAQISGFMAQTAVTQTYSNPFENPIEAVYVFPLPEDSAVNGFTMTIGERVIIGMIMKRADAKATYERARAQGYRAALLEQERPNIFMQSIANIAPLEEVKVELKFMNRLKRDGATYSWHFPMVVGPRFTGGAPDAERITPPLVDEGKRTGNDISLSVELDSGLPITDLRVKTHDFRQVQHSPSQYHIELAAHETIPNRDFVLEYDVFGAELKTGYAAHASDGEGFVALMIAPPKDPTPGQIAAREVVFLIDVSGSMRGQPLEIVKDVASQVIKGMRPDDKLNIMTYSGGTKQLWDASKLATAENTRDALYFIQGLSGGGGTRMDLGIQNLLKLPRDGERMRMVAFLTDGYVGNETELLTTIKQRKDDSTRIFAFGIGSSVNRFLLEQIGKHGQGHTQIVMANEYGDSDKAVTTFFQNIASPVFTHITADWSDIGQVESYPSQIADVYAGKPVNLVARYDASKGPLSGKLKLRGYLGGQQVEISLEVDLPASEPNNSGLAAVWAREKIETIKDERLGQSGNDADALTAEIVDTALKYSIVSEGTSFVAVDKDGGRVGDGNPNKVKQPVEVPAGVDRKGIEGGE